MARGEVFPIGYERVAQNGYHYIKCITGWRLRHHLIAEEALGRPIDSQVEMVCFKDRDRHNFDPDNIIVEAKKGMTKDKKIAYLKDKIAQLQGELEELEEEEVSA
jgi:hypothetical protein